MYKKYFDRWFISFARFLKIDIVMLLSDELYKANKRNIILSQGCSDALNSIPNIANYEHPTVNILQNALYYNKE